MKIIKFEQSGVIIEADSGYRLAIDIGIYTPIEKLEGIAVNAIFVSHVHGDHFSPAHIKKLSPQKLYLGRECAEAARKENLPAEIIEVKASDLIEIDGIKIKLFEVDHGPNVKVKPKENFGFLIEVDGKKIYYAGEIFSPSGLDVTSLEVDVAMIPTGTFYTFGPSEAIAFAKQFKKIRKLIPMHYEKTPETREEFVRLAEIGGFDV